MTSLKVKFLFTGGVGEMGSTIAVAEAEGAFINWRLILPYWPRKCVVEEMYNCITIKCDSFVNIYIAGIGALATIAAILSYVAISCCGTDSKFAMYRVTENFN